MKCDKCQASEATVHEVMIKGGKRHEKHLCEQCAKSEGVAPQVVVHTPITQLLTQYITAQAEQAGAAAAGAGGQAGTPPGVAPTKCGGCGLTYGQFRTSGLLGCPECYIAFEQQLTPLLARAHEGGTTHAGKSPRRPQTGVSSGGQRGVVAADRAAIEANELRRIAEQARAAKLETEKRAAADRIAALNKQLKDAVAAEQYEKAAQLRDQINSIERATAVLAMNPPVPNLPLGPATKKAMKRAAPGKPAADAPERKKKGDPTSGGEASGPGSGGDGGGSGGGAT